MASIYTLSEDDVRVLRRLADRERRNVQTTQQRPAVPDILPQTPDVYIALTPAGGIPPISEETIGTSSGSGSGSAADALADVISDNPGFADCNIYQIVHNNFGDEVVATGVSVRVYNLSSTAVPGKSWIPVAREKFGSWIAISAPDIRLQVLYGSVWSITPNGYLFPGTLSNGLGTGPIDINGQNIFPQNTDVAITAGLRTVTISGPYSSLLDQVGINNGAQLLIVDDTANDDGVSEMVTVVGTNISAHVSVTVSGGSITAATVASGGTGYPAGQVKLRAVGWNSSGGYFYFDAGYATVSGGAVVNPITITDNGGGALSAGANPINGPIFYFDAPPGSPSSFTATFQNSYLSGADVVPGGVWFYPLNTGASWPVTKTDVTTPIYFLVIHHSDNSWEDVFGAPVYTLIDTRLLSGFYSSAAPSNWANPPPTTVSSALDRLAAAVYTLRSNSPIP